MLVLVMIVMRAWKDDVDDDNDNKALDCTIILAVDDRREVDRYTVELTEKE